MDTCSFRIGLSELCQTCARRCVIGHFDSQVGLTCNRRGEFNIIWRLSGSESYRSSFLMCDRAFLKSVDLLPCHCCEHLCPFISFSFSHFLTHTSFPLPCYLRLLVCVATASSSGLVHCASHNQILNKSGKRERAYVTEEGRRVLVPSSPSEERDSYMSGCNEKLMLMVLMDRYFFFLEDTLSVYCKNKISMPLRGCGAGAVCVYLVCSVSQEIIKVIQLLCNIYLSLMICRGDYRHRRASWHLHLGPVIFQEARVSSASVHCVVVQTIRIMCDF